MSYIFHSDSCQEKKQLVTKREPPQNKTVPQSNSESFSTQLKVYLQRLHKLPYS